MVGLWEEERGRKGKEDEGGKQNAGRGKGKGREEKGREKKEKRKGEGERERWYPTFWYYKVTPMSAREIHTRRIGLATRNQSIKE